MNKSQLIIYGRNPVKEALRSHLVIKAYLLNGFSDKSLLDLLRKEKVKIEYKSINELNRLADNNVHQGVVAEIKNYEYKNYEYLLSKIKDKKNPVLVVLDGINDTHNFGAILRTCDVFGVDAVIVSKHNQVPLNATVAKSSAGAINYVDVVQVSNLNQTILNLKDKGFWVVASDGSAKTSYMDIDYNFPVILIVGSEGNGISSLLLKNSDFIVKIPQFGHVNSLNASVAFAIIISKIKNIV